MKKLLVFSLCCALGFSCSSDDNDDAGVFEVFNLKVYVVNPLLSPDSDVTYEDGDITWSFNLEAQRVKVTVAEGIDAVRLAPGSYDFTLNDNLCNYGDNRYFHVNDDSIGLLILDNYSEGQITISDACIDGPVFYFERD